MEGNSVSAYPFWNPQGAGAAENFAAPYRLTGTQVQAQIADSLRLKVPQETGADLTYLPVWQYVPAFVPLPQGPAHVPDPYAQARSLLDYARSTLGTSQLGTEDGRGQGGRANKIGV